jgi:zinc transporter ZupT
MTRTKTILLSLLSIISLMTVGFSQKLALNFTQYYERRQIWLEIAVSIHLIVISFLAFYYFIKKDKKTSFTFLICLVLSFLVLLISAIIMAANFEGINLKI